MNNLILLLPEFILLIFGFVIFILDLYWKGNPDENKLSWYPILAFIGAMTAFVATIYLWFGGFTLGIVATDPAGEVPMLAVDQFALFFKAYAALTVGLVGLASTEYVRKRTSFQGEFYALMLFAAMSLMLVASSTNLVMIFLAFEFLSITSYLLTGYLRDDKLSIEAAVKYFIYGSAASAVMLYGLSLLYGATGSMDLYGISQGLAAADATVSQYLVIPSIVLILAGLGFKIALVPFHYWSPEAYQGAPTPVTAFLSVGPKAAGFALMVRIMMIAFPDFAYSANTNWVLILSAIAIVTMTLGNVVAMWQTNLKRLFAYSSIAHAGYMLIGVIAVAPSFLNSLQGGQAWNEGVNGLMLYLLAYLFTNIGVFSIIIVIENKTGSTDIEQYAGLLKRSPFLAIAFFIFLLSLIGIPPTAGFMGKLMVFGAAIEQQMYLIAIVAIINSVISVYYYFQIARQMMFTEPTDTSPITFDRSMNAAIWITTVLVLVMGIWAQPFINWANNSAQIVASIF